MPFKFFSSKTQSKPSAPSTGGRLVYAIGDVHGHLDLLDQLLDLIVQDAAASGRDQVPVLILVGDYVDRGPESRGVIDRLIALGEAAANLGRFEARFLLGNHEQTLLAFLESPEGGPAWAEFGGGETLASYGVAPPPGRGDPESWKAVQAEFRGKFPPQHEAFLRRLELSARYGDYLFVHAGVRPGVPIEQQDPEDLVWIRGDFLSEPHRLGCVVVHGHTPSETPFLGPDRINIDTGAYATGVLTAVKLSGEAPVILNARKIRRP
ncbi:MULTISPECIES: metallophosphoesterase family protein [unclassified Caulobacter]|uniref:metallophosphoesterase family protein n=1 Tax=unclassified Caulobacter TaxID=2648921 RepID=UPI0004A761F0|nr:metallophosphoesterase family protein [Caulobacter sp. UNC358MFTsu5.1]